MSGFAKFDVDFKLKEDDFCDIIEKLSLVDDRFNQTAFEDIVQVFDQVWKDQVEVYKGDLENE